MDNTFIVTILGFVLALTVTGVFYEALCQISHVISKIGVKPRKHMYIMITGIFVAHTLAIFIYAVTYWGLIQYAGFAELGGITNTSFQDYFYFSITSYTSLGVGDIYPIGGLRLLTGIETLNGLILITWSATFTYFSVQKMWEAHGIEPKFCCPPEIYAKKNNKEE